MSEPGPSEPRPFEREVTKLVGHIAAALALPVETVVAMLEEGTLALSMETDERGIRHVVVAHGEGADRRRARIYKDTIHHLGAPPPDGPPPWGESEDAG